MFFKSTRIRDRKHLDWLRELPCVRCSSGGSEASHIRLMSNSGTGLKPSDDRALPLCHRCHMASHSGEKTFWGFKIDQAIELAQELYKVTGDRSAAIKLILKAGL